MRNETGHGSSPGRDRATVRPRTHNEEEEVTKSPARQKSAVSGKDREQKGYCTLGIACHLWIPPASAQLAECPSALGLHEGREQGDSPHQVASLGALGLMIASC